MIVVVFAVDSRQFSQLRFLFTRKRYPHSVFTNRVPIGFKYRDIWFPPTQLAYFTAQKVTLSFIRQQTARTNLYRERITTLHRVLSLYPLILNSNGSALSEHSAFSRFHLTVLLFLIQYCLSFYTLYVTFLYSFRPVRQAPRQGLSLIHICLLIAITFLFIILNVTTMPIIYLFPLVIFHYH